MSKFIKGLDLSEQFFYDIAKPILDQHYPKLIYSAGLIGYGSDVLGFDDEISTDHMWGPRFYLFLDDNNIKLKDSILNTFSKSLPYIYNGYSVNFSDPDPDDGGVRHPELISSGTVSPLIFINTFDNYLNEYLGLNSFEGISELDWLALSEHRLLAITSGKFFVDYLHIKEVLDTISFYPEQVRLYLIASNWSLISEEQAFVKRCSDVGDEVGSILVCTRIAERLMRLSFLYCNKYAPYSKWFGKAFDLLPIDISIKNTIRNAVTANNIIDREENIVHAQKLLANLHNSLGISEFVDVNIENYFGRDIKVIFADKIFRATVKRLENTSFMNYPFIGTLSEVSNLTGISDKPNYIDNIKALYKQSS
jgi:hypothetical protein